MAGYPDFPGIYAPTGIVDLRTVVYSPDSEYADSVLSAVMALFGEDFDPPEASRLVERVFLPKPPLSLRGNILVADLAAGPSGSVQDYGAGLLFALVAPSRETDSSGIPLVVIDEAGDTQNSRTARALLAAASTETGSWHDGAARGRPIVIIQAAGNSGNLPVHEGPGLSVIVVNCLSSELPDLLRHTVDRYPGFCIPGTADNPAFFTASLILETALFAEEKRNFAGEFHMACSSLDTAVLASGLWAWGLGLPITGFILGAVRGSTLAFSQNALVADFERIKPGILRSMGIFENVTPTEVAEALEKHIEGGGPPLVYSDSIALAAACKAHRGGQLAVSSEAVRLVVKRLTAPVPTKVAETPVESVLPSPVETIESDPDALFAAIRWISR